jgi:hypothetical protein
VNLLRKNRLINDRIIVLLGVITITARKDMSDTLDLEFVKRY